MSPEVIGSHVLGIQMLDSAIVGSHTPKWQFRSLSSLAAVHVGWIILDHIGSYWIILDHIAEHVGACRIM